MQKLILFSCLLGATISKAAEIRMGVKPGLKFDLPGFHAKPGEEVELIFTNNDEMMHNIVFTKPGTRLQVVEAAIALGAEGLAKHFVPEIPAVLASTPVVQPGQAFTLKFKAPNEPAEYPYVCTFPGHGFVMHGSMFVAQKRPAALDALLAKAKTEPGAEVSEMPLAKAKLMRTFMPGSSPAAIAVALPGGHSYCWDAGNCRLRYVWRGRFIQRNGSYGRWRTLPTILGPVYYREPSMPFRFEGDEEVPATQFLGYRFIDGIPEFRYQLGNYEVREFLTKLPGKSGLIRRFSIQGLQGKALLFQKDLLAGVEIHSDKGTWDGNILKLTPNEAESFTLEMVEIPNQAPIEYWSMDDLSHSYPNKGSLAEGHLGRAWKFSSSPLIKTQHEFAEFQDAFAVSFWVQVSNSKGNIASFCGWGEPGQGPTLFYQGLGAGLQVGTPPDIPVSQGNYLEAEHAKVQGAAKLSKNQGHTGSGYVDYNAASGESIEWNTSVKDPGKYILRFRYAVAGGARPLKVVLNDKTLAEKGDFAETGSWTNWKNLDFPVTLQKGKQTIRLSSIGSSGPNVDHLSLLYLDGKEKDIKNEKPPAVPIPPEKGHALEKETWHHILANYSDGKLTLYVNGKPIQTKEFSTETFIPSAKFYLGPITSGNPYLMDELRLFARSLSDAEIQELYNR